MRLSENQIVVYQPNETVRLDVRLPTAIEVNIRIMRAFSAMRRFLLANAQMFQRIETVEKRQIATDAKVIQ